MVIQARVSPRTLTILVPGAFTWIRYPVAWASHPFGPTDSFRPNGRSGGRFSWASPESGGMLVLPLSRSFPGHVVSRAQYTVPEEFKENGSDPDTCETVSRRSGSVSSLFGCQPRRSIIRLIRPPPKTPSKALSRKSRPFPPGLPRTSLTGHPRASWGILGGPRRPPSADKKREATPRPCRRPPEGR